MVVLYGCGGISPLHWVWFLQWSMLQPDQIASDDEARYIELEESTMKRIADDDADYEDT